MKKIKPILLFFLITTAFLSACSLNLSLQVDADGSGDFSLAYIFNADDKELLESMKISQAALCKDMQTQGLIPKSVALTQEEHGTETWCTGIIQFDELDELAKELDDIDGIQVNKLEIKDGTLFHDIDFSLSDEGSPALFTVFWELSAPGTVIETNAETVQSNTLFWTLSTKTNNNLYAKINLPIPTPTPKPIPTATPSPLPGNSNFASENLTYILLMMGCCLSAAFIVLVGVIIYLIRNKKNSREDKAFS